MTGRRNRTNQNSDSAADPMDNLIKVRNSKEKIWKQEADSLQAEIDADSPDEEDLEVQFGLFRHATEGLLAAQQQIFDVLATKGNEAIYLREETWCATTRRTIAKLEVKVKKIMASFSAPAPSGGSRPSGSETGRRLPRLELPKFGGDVREWLPYWSQFEEIHKDKNIADSDKFQYLVQSMIDGSEAKEVVMSYPITAKNYPLAVEQLQKRYGRERMLVKVYVRDLIRLVIDNATHEKSSLSNLYVKLSAQLRALGTLGVTTDKCAAVIYPLVESCLPEEVLRAWQRDPSYKEAQEKDGEEELKLLISFLEREVGAEDNIKLACSGLSEEVKVSKEKQKSKKSSVPTAASLVAVPDEKKKSVCLICGNGHPTWECGQADKFTLEEKKSKIHTGRVCWTCLKQGHNSKKCKAFVKCAVCGRKHHTIMCPDLPHHRTSAASESSKKEEKAETTHSTPSMANQELSPDVAMQTLVVEVVGAKYTVRTRLLVDTGSQKSYITKELAERVGLRKLGEEKVNHILFGGVQTTAVTHNLYKLELRKLGGGYGCNFTVSDVPVISGKISSVPKGPWINELKKENIVLSDYCHGLHEIGILVGADVSAKLVTGEKIELKSGPVAVNTLFGWTLMGKLNGLYHNKSSTASCHVATMSNLDVLVPKIWELDVLGITDSTESRTRKELEEAAMEHFNSTVVRTTDGRYEVCLPWIEGHQPLPSNRNIAEKRLKSATDKMKKDGIFQVYDEELKKWEEAGKIEEVKEEDWNNTSHYLPHRAVIKVGSTTPVRPVFDASCKVKGSPSLNDCLEKGPNMLEKIPAVLTKIRLEEVGAVADIEKAFQQIGIANRDRDSLRFLWWTDDTCKKLKIYRHCRVVFGVTASPFLLAATLKHIAEHAPDNLKTSAELFVDCTYVDNLAVSVPNMVELDKLKSECDELLLPAKFNLRGWEYGRRDEDKTVSLLGMLWNLKEDNLKLDLGAFVKKLEGPLTKRKILSLVHMVFDPIGFSCPVTLIPRKMLQEAWCLKLGWDTELPVEMEEDFRKWSKTVLQLPEVKVPRRLNPLSINKEDWELHMFADASQNAYAAVVYVRIASENGATIQLVQAKSRVKPITKVTIPRLELLACLIGSRLLSAVKNMLGIPEAATYCWTDSSTAYHWMCNSGTWGVFVQRRVEEIRSLTQLENWRHVPGEMNPADLPSRGCNVEQLIKSSWWEGPKWLYLPKEKWPKSDVSYKEEEINSERKKTVVSSLNCDPDELQTTVCSLLNYEEMVKFIYRSTMDGKGAEMTNNDFMKAEKSLLAMVQKWSFTGKDDEKLKKLPIVVMEDGSLKLNTRLLLGDFTDEFKQPLVLPSDSKVVAALIRYEHERNCHAGVSTLLSILRERFWILKGRRTVKAAIRTCESCQRFSVKNVNPPTPALPKERISASSPFQVTGVDYFGYLTLKNGNKTWVALFTCAVYRAVHLELVPSLTTEDFIQAFRRFVSRRGRPDVIYSDNGTNFTGCNNAFREINWKKIMKYGNFRRIDWRFNPPTASWYGGWFERLVGVVKQTLRKVLGKSSLNREELATVLCEVEAVVNQRPLTYISEESDQLHPLTPQLFLTGEKSSYLPESLEVNGSSLNKTLKYGKEVSTHLRTRFRKEYLGQLPHMRNKDEKKSVKVGDVVLIGHDNQKRLDWPMGRIIEVIPGKDGKIRVVRVKTEGGELLRPVKRLYPLEVDSPEEFIDEESLCKKVDKRIEGVTRSGRKVKIPERLTYLYL